MALVCPLCETPNADDAAECAACGKVLTPELELLDLDEERVAGLEHTQLVDGALEAPAERLAELEPTFVASPRLRAPDERLEGVERTALEADPAEPSRWTGEVELDTGRAEPDGERTPDPVDLGRCGFCGFETTEALCGNCGRRRARYTQAPAAQAAAPSADGDGVLCPACFARVPPGPRCIECGVPFAVREL